MINIRTAVLTTNPETLREISLKKILILIDRINRSNGQHQLPCEVGQLVLSSLRDYILINCLAEADCRTLLTPLTTGSICLKELDLSGLPIDAELFSKFIEKHKDIQTIDISGCENLTDIKFLPILVECLQKCNVSLKTLIVGETVAKMMINNKKEYELLLPDMKLKKLVCNGLNPRTGLSSELCSEIDLIDIQSMADTLTHLDLSGSALTDGKSLISFKKLHTLILYNCRLKYPDIINNICKLTNLRVLDLSQEYEDENDFLLNDYEEGVYSLNDIVTRLPNLTSLDLSCTCLVSRRDRYLSVLDIRKDRPFDFLGLFHTTYVAIGKTNIPARMIASESNELHLLNTLKAYIDRPKQLVTALVDLFNLYKATSHQDTFDYVSEAMEVVLEILTRHLTEDQVIIKGTAVLWYMIKINLSTRNSFVTSKDNNSMDDIKVMKQIIGRCLDAMQYHRQVESILINCGLILLFLPDLVYEYTRVTRVSLLMCSDQSPRLQNFGTSLINHLACQVTGDQKLQIGKLKAIETMMDIIKKKIHFGTCDETLESAWCTLWNITDETVDNCRTFLEHDGIDAFKNCMDKFSDNRELLKNMMGLLGNVAECPDLRIEFMEADLLQRFYGLISSPTDTIECSYNACGILAHIVSDGEEIWVSRLGGKSSRAEFLRHMKEVIDCWPINSRRNINYRSFEPIVRLLKPHVPPEAQYWALFALTNLTRVDPAKYCNMLVPHDGLVTLRKIANRVYETEPYVRNLALIALYQYEKFVTDKSLYGLELSDSIDLDEIKNFNYMEVMELVEM